MILLFRSLCKYFLLTTYCPQHIDLVDLVNLINLVDLVDLVDLVEPLYPT